MLIREASLAIVNRVGALLLGGAFLWQVVEHVGPFQCEAVIHVSESNADMMIDNVTYRVGNVPRETPIVCELAPGQHRLIMHRSGKLLYEKEFSLKPGEEPF